MDEKLTARHIALLAPVPSEHLTSAAEKIKKVPMVAFSSKMSELFADLEVKRNNMLVDVFLYASHSDGGFDGVVSWRAKYVGIADKETAKPYRPDSTWSDTYDSEIFWLVKDISELEEGKRIHVASFTGYGKMNPYGKAFPPHRPLLVKHPSPLGR